MKIQYFRIPNQSHLIHPPDTSDMREPLEIYGMQVTPRRHELISCLLLGIGTLFMYLGYHTQSFITESIIRSVATRDPERISAFAGYYGQALHYATFAISTLFTPSLLHYLSSRWILVLATILFSFYHLGFFYVNSYFFYFTQMLMGVAYSLYNNGEGAYLAEHSSRRTVESNAGIETAVGHTSMTAGGICLLAIFYFLPSSGNAETFRSFSDEHIKAIYATFFALSIVAIVIFALLPRKQNPDSISNTSPRVLPGLKKNFQNLIHTITHPNMLLLACTSFYMGLIVSYMLGIYPTSLSFTSSLKDDTYIIAFYAVFVGLGEIAGGVFLRPLIKNLGQYKLVVIMGSHVVTIVIIVAISLLAVPNRATIEPSITEELVLAPSRLLACVIGLFFGLADFTITMARAVICQYAIPEARGEVFSLTRLFQCLSSGIVLFLGPYLTVRCWAAILLVGVTVGAGTFIVVVRRTNAVADQIALNNDEGPIEKQEKESSEV